MDARLTRSIDTGDSRIFVGVLVADTTTSSPKVEEGFNETDFISPAAATLTSVMPKPMEEKRMLTGNLVFEGKLSLKLPLLSVKVPLEFPFKVTETEPRDSPPEALFTFPVIITFCALTIAGSIINSKAAKQANLFISSSFDQILAKIGIVNIINKF